MRRTHPEAGLARVLGTGQLLMIGLGGAIGTGLFMGSGIAIAYAGPAVVMSYAIAGLIALIVMHALAEMTVMHPGAGSFGTHADLYWNEWAGFTVRATYCAAQIAALGGEAVAVGQYLTFFWPDLPLSLGAAAAGLGVIAINLRPVRQFGAIEFVMSSIKAFAIIAFILFGCGAVLGLGVPSIGTANYFVDGGPLPHGWSGVWMGVLMAIFSFVGIEMIAVASGEAAEPDKAVPQAMHGMLARLLIFYGGGLAIMVAIVPWTHAGAKIVTESPFVRVFELYGLSFAAALMNVVVILAALSSMNALVYLSSRMLFSLGRGGIAPAIFGTLSSQGVPVIGIACATLGIIIATLTALLSPAAYNYLLGLALFGAIWTWATILITHMRFKRATKASGGLPLSPLPQLIALALLAAVLVTMALDREFWYVAIVVGVPWIALISLLYARGRARRPVGPVLY